MPALNLQSLLIACFVSLLVGAGMAWTINGWRLGAELQREKAGYAVDLKSLSDAALAQSAKLQAQHDADVERIDAIARDYNEEINHAKIENDQLRADIASGTRRLYVAAKCPSSSGQMSATGNNIASTTTEARAELESAAAQRIIDITSDGDAAVRQLNALIDSCASTH